MPPTTQKLTFLFIMIFLWLSMTFSDNILSTAPYQGFSTFQSDSDTLAADRIFITATQGSAAEGGFLIRRHPDGTIFPYISQFGLQGRLISATTPAIMALSEKIYPKLVTHIPTLTPFSITINIYHTIFATATSAIISGILIWVYLEFGLIPLIFAFLSIIASPAMISMARNLYWIPATWFAPMLLSAAFLRYTENSRLTASTMAVVLFAIGLITIFIKSLCGYEYLSTVTIAGATPIVYHAIKSNRGYRSGAFLVAAFGFGAIIGFLCAIYVHCQEIALAFHVTFGEALNTVRNRLILRTGAALGEVTLPENLKNMVIPPDQLDVEAEKSSAIYVMAIYLLKGYMARMLFLPAIVWIALLAHATKRLLSSNAALVATAWFSATAPISWYILAKQHSYAHTHINFILWNVPFTIMVAISVAKAWFPNDRIVIGKPVEAAPRPTTPPVGG